MTTWGVSLAIISAAGLIGVGLSVVLTLLLNRRWDTQQLRRFASRDRITERRAAELRRIYAHLRDGP